MMSKRVLIAFAVVFVFSLAGLSYGLATEPNQVKCPVMGGAANKRVYTDYQGKRIYFCCPPCIQQFKRNPEKFMKQFEKEGIILEDAPEAGKE